VKGYRYFDPNPSPMVYGNLEKAISMKLLKLAQRGRRALKNKWVYRPKTEVNNQKLR